MNYLQFQCSPTFYLLFNKRFFHARIIQRPVAPQDTMNKHSLNVSIGDDYQIPICHLTQLKHNNFLKSFLLCN